MESLSPEHLRAFYDTGIEEIKRVTSRLEQITGTPVHVRRALDFGCGTGRLSQAMQKFADEVVGFDISPKMIEAARRHSPGNILYSDQIPTGNFGWINSYIVFQHIPPERGMVMLERLLAQLEPGGLISLQFAIYRDAPLVPPPKGLRDALATAWRIWNPPELPLYQAFKQIWPSVGTMFMYDYDLNQIFAACHRNRIDELTLVHTNHGGHHGVEVYGRRAG